MVNENVPDGAPILYVIFTAEINPSTIEQLTGVMVQAAKKQIGEVYLALSTSGGLTQSGIALYHTLAGMPFKLTIHNIGNVDSIGNVVFLAGHSRYGDFSRDVHVSRSCIRCTGAIPP